MTDDLECAVGVDELVAELGALSRMVQDAAVSERDRSLALGAHYALHWILEGGPSMSELHPSSVTACGLVLGIGNDAARPS